MLEKIQFYFASQKLFRKRDKVQRKFLQYRKDLISNQASTSDLDSLLHEERTEVDLIDYEIERLKTNYYRRICFKNFLELPDWGDDKYWIESSLGDYGGKVLSNLAVSELRSQIAKYKKELYGGYIQIITAFTGLAGVIVAIISVLKS